VIGTRVFSGTPFEDAAGYARAVVAGGRIYVSGTVGWDAKARALPEGAEAQCEQCFANVTAALEEAGATLADMVRIRVFVASREEFERIKPIIRRHSLAARPANTTIICELPDPAFRVEIEVTALRPEPSGIDK
jgi:enamine deaminase RidA (YjgF/YER057c/UK114 family)